jgi:hypothetical protein
LDLHSPIPPTPPTNGGKNSIYGNLKLLFFHFDCTTTAGEITGTIKRVAGRRITMDTLRESNYVTTSRGLTRPPIPTALNLSVIA